MANRIERAGLAAAGAAPSRRSPARMKQLSFGSQAKIVLFLALPTTAILFALLILFDLGGAFRHPPDVDYAVVLMALAVVGAIFGLGIAMIQVAGLVILRLLPWRGPALEIEEVRDPGLAGIFE